MNADVIIGRSKQRLEGRTYGIGASIFDEEDTVLDPPAQAKKCLVDLTTTGIIDDIV